MSGPFSRLQQLEQGMLGLSAQCQVLRRPLTGQLQCCVRGLSTEGNFNYHRRGAALSQHYGQLQLLLEQRAQLLFHQEYAQRTRFAILYVNKLTRLLEQELRLLTDRSRVCERPNSAWFFGMEAMCQELRSHMSHWDVLCAKARSDVWLRTTLFQRTETLAVMRRTLRVLGLQAMLLMEQCIYAAFSALASAQLARVPTDALEDLLAGVEFFNRVLEEQRVQHGGLRWRNESLLLSNWHGLSRSSATRGRILPSPYPVVELMRILAEHRGKMAAEELYLWVSQQNRLNSQALRTGAQPPTWEELDLLFPLLSPLHSNDSSPNRPALESFQQATLDEPRTGPPFSWSCDFPFTTFIHQDTNTLEILFQALVSSTDLLAPHIPNRPMAEWSHTPDYSFRGGEEGSSPTDEARTEMKRPKSVQWLDVGQSEACVELFGRYRTMLWMEFGRALIRCFHHPPRNSSLDSVNHWSDQMVLQLVMWLNHGCRAEVFPEECRGVVGGFTLHLLSNAVFRHWDKVMCAALGSGLNDKCLPGVDQENSMVMTSTMEQLSLLFPPLVTMFRFLHTSAQSGKGDSNAQVMTSLQLGLHCRAVASLQTSTFWVMSKAYQFLSSWSLNKFLLISLGDLKVLRASVERLLQHVEALCVKGNHNILKQQAAQLTQGVTDLQVFSERVFRIFSNDCKRMSEDIFEQTMPSAKHWRVNYKTEFPRCPSDYAASAAQSVIGQVLEGVQLLPKEEWAPALTEAMTAFMEAWMEHILKQKIKFSIQGALQLKQDFDLIRDLIRSEEYSLSEEIHQRLLSLRVFHQVDNAIVCLLQQPVSKPYMPSRGWKPFRHCCSSNADVMDQSSSIQNNFESMDFQSACQQALAQTEGTTTPELLASSPQESYLAVAQQEWLDLRIQNGNRWKLPGLRCLTRSEP
ncbi:hypothetical protein DPEC_G00023400 [Dallia pectoralis]|uniref:Uncharacterized protein n=1 Tax=Dallia pectoralis TaxID=75939 RepID=A0ACC2HGP9_DALPE|nr:hypothetical protein DPEC_G00023400 [Dallia pectoralis]